VRYQGKSRAFRPTFRNLLRYMGLSLPPVASTPLRLYRVRKSGVRFRTLIPRMHKAVRRLDSATHCFEFTWILIATCDLTAITTLDSEKSQEALTVNTAVVSGGGGGGVVPVARGDVAHAPAIATTKANAIG
jgi:hypothetical protein